MFSQKKADGSFESHRLFSIGAYEVTLSLMLHVNSVSATDRFITVLLLRIDTSSNAYRFVVLATLNIASTCLDHVPGLPKHPLQAAKPSIRTFTTFDVNQLRIPIRGSYPFTVSAQHTLYGCALL